MNRALWLLALCCGPPLWAQQPVTLQSGQSVIVRAAPLPAAAHDTTWCSAGICRPVPPSAPAPSGKGIAVGPWNYPYDSVGAFSYNGGQMAAFVGMGPGLRVVKTRRGQIGLSIRRPTTLSAGQYSVRAACAEIASWKGQDDPALYRDVVKVLVIADDISNAFNGPNPPYYARIDSVARCVHLRWPWLATAVRQKCSKMSTSYVWRWLDNCWAQYSGAKHGDGTPAQYLTVEEAAGKLRKLGRIYGLNVLDGGDGSSGIYGTFPNPTNPAVDRWQMTALEGEKAAKALLLYTCGLFNWTWSPGFKGTDPGRTASQLKGIAAYDLRADVRAAWQRIRAMADTLPARPCWVRP